MKPNYILAPTTGGAIQDLSIFLDNQDVDNKAKLYKAHMYDNNYLLAFL